MSDYLSGLRQSMKARTVGGGAFFDAYAKSTGLRKRTHTESGFLGLTIGPFGKDVTAYDPAEAKPVEDLALKAYERRNPYGDGLLPDYTDTLLQRLQSAEMIRLGIGRTRQSTFTLNPATAIASGYGQ